MSQCFASGKFDKSQLRNFQTPDDIELVKDEYNLRGYTRKCCIEVATRFKFRIDGLQKIWKNA